MENSLDEEMEDIIDTFEDLSIKKESILKLYTECLECNNMIHLINYSIIHDKKNPNFFYQFYARSERKFYLCKDCGGFKDCVDFRE